VQRDLVVRAGGERRVLERLAHLLVVVDLAVADEPDVTGGIGKRLVAAVDVDDRQAPVAEPGPVDVHGPFVVGPAMRQQVEHATCVGGRVPAVDGSDSAHQADSLWSR
jgi:hypothetical protein